MSGNQWGPPQGPPNYGPPPQQPGQYGPPPHQPGHFGPPPGGPQPQAYYGPPPGGPQYGWGPLPGGQPPPKKSGGKVVLALGVLAVLAAAGVFIGLRVTQGGDDGPSVARPVATAEPTYSKPSVPVATTTEPTIPPPTRQPTRSVTSPKPVQTFDPLKFVATHRLYKTGVQRPVNCKEPRVGLANASKATAYYRAVKACLDRAWPRQVAASGRTFRAPTLVSWVGTANSPCGNSDRSLSFYCSSNHTIYMDVADDVSYWKRNQGFTRALATHTVAHEYAHALQQMTGILPAFYQVRYDAPSQAAKLLVNRRMELQASCLGNIFLGTNRNSYPIKGELYRQWLWVVTQSGDVSYLPRDHGSKASHGSWSRAAFTSRNVGKCNTFTASPAKVN